MRKLLFYTASLSLLLLAGCSKYLDKLPLDQPSDATFITNETEMNLAVTSCYTALWLSPTGNEAFPFATALECASDIGWDRNGSELTQIALGVATPLNGAMASFWTSFYGGIANCNYFLSRKDQLNGVVDAAKINTAVGEARFLRALYYSYLTELYGAVPLIDKPLTLETAQLSRTSKDSVVDFMLADLDSAAAYLPVTAAAGKATKGAALALAARVALYNSRWQIAADEAKKAMDLNAFSLNPDYAQLFTYAGKNSKEIIFAVQYLIGKKTQSIPYLYFSRMAQGASSKIPVESLVDSYECTDGLPIDKSPLYNPKNPFANRDPRLTGTVVLPQTQFMGYVFETNRDSLTTWNYNTTPPTRVANTEATHAYASFSGFIWRKYTDATDKTHVYGSELPIILIRYAEVLLSYAEAKIELNQLDQSVYDAINAVRTRKTVNMPAITTGKTQDELRAIVRRERKYELAGEGLRLFDIRRWKLAEQVLPGPLYGRIPTGYLANAPMIDQYATPHYDNVTNKDKMRVIETRVFNKDRDYLWPIWQTEMETNRALVQNPGY